MVVEPKITLITLISTEILGEVIPGITQAMAKTQKNQKIVNNLQMAN